MHVIITMSNNMIIYKILSLFSTDIIENKKNTSNPQLIKYFKTEFGTSWKIELDKYIIRNEENND